MAFLNYPPCVTLVSYLFKTGIYKWLSADISFFALGPLSLSELFSTYFTHALSNKCVFVIDCCVLVPLFVENLGAQRYFVSIYIYLSDYIGRIVCSIENQFEDKSYIFGIERWNKWNSLFSIYHRSIFLLVILTQKRAWCAYCFEKMAYTLKRHGMKYFY